MSLIELKQVSHVFPDGSMGIEAVNLSISAGEFLAIAGANGSGKTTLCRHLNGLLKPTSGEILLDGKPLSRNLPAARQMVGMVFQNADTQIIGETVQGDVAFGPENLGLDRADITRRVEAALETVGLGELAHQKPNLLSGGEKKRLAIAGILAMEPRVLVFDEPFSNLDYPGSCQILEQLLVLHEARHTIIVVTHDLEQVAAYIDRLILMQEGQIVRNGTPEILVKEAEQFGVREPVSSRNGLGLQPWLR